MVVINKNVQSFILAFFIISPLYAQPDSTIILQGTLYESIADNFEAGEANRSFLLENDADKKFYTIIFKQAMQRYPKPGQVEVVGEIQGDQLIVDHSLGHSIRSLTDRLENGNEINPTKKDHDCKESKTI